MIEKFTCEPFDFKIYINISINKLVRFYIPFSKFGIYASMMEMEISMPKFRKLKIKISYMKK